MLNLADNEVWFVTGSQHLYGDETLRHVAEHCRRSPARSRGVRRSRCASCSSRCSPRPTGSATSAGGERRPGVRRLITWMHTFSPAKMWIAGLSALQKPFLHLHTQYNRDIPWADIDMDFMNLNQSAHGDREFGFIGTRLRLERKVVVGHWQDPAVAGAAGRVDARGGGVADWQDARRSPASATTCARSRSPKATRSRRRSRLGYRVNGYGVGDLVALSPR